MEWLTSMFSYLGTTAGVIGIVVLVVLLIILAVLGKVNLRFGKNVITFGRVAKRSCGDCMLLLMAKRERMESQRIFYHNRILKEQMNFVEQKILEMNSLFLNSYREQLHELAPKDTTPTEFNKQYKLYQGLLGSTMVVVKDEFRRSFKENGFEEMSGQEFTHYVKGKLANIVSLGREHLFNLYPYDGMIVSITARKEWLDSKLSALEDICFEIYGNAKNIKRDAVKKIDEIEKEFSKEIDEIVLIKDK